MHYKIAGRRLLSGTIQLLAGLKVIIDRFFKSGTQFCNGFTVKTHDITDACYMSDKAAVVLTIVTASSISLILHDSCRPLKTDYSKLPFKLPDLLRPI